MARFVVFAAGLLTVTSFANADLCDVGRVEIDGNWFCQPVDGITYANVGTPGVYNDVVQMASDGTCSSASKPFQGPIAPFDEEISFHFRGPLKLKQFAAYSPIASTANQQKTSPARNRRHGHAHENFHTRRGAEKRQQVTATIDGQVVSWENNWFGNTATPVSGDAATSTSSTVWVTATIDGKVVSWVNNWFGETTTLPAAAPSPWITATIDGQVVSWPNNNGVKPTVTPQSVLAAVSAGLAKGANIVAAMPTAQVLPIPSPVGIVTPVIDGSTVYERTGYYDSASQILDKLVFLANYGGQGSGVFDYYYGASLSYLNSAGTGGSSSPQILGADVTIPSEHEFTIMTANECGSDSSCGFIRPGAVAYHGFGGADKVFMIEFEMPMDGLTGFEGNMPAIWALNAKIPRTLQYGNIECSCWESGCGEFDIVEALNDGSAFLKSTLHDNKSGGDSDYIVRPETDTMKLAVVFSSATSSIRIQVLPNSTDFSSSLTAGEIEGLCASRAGNPVSLFTIS